MGYYYDYGAFAGIWIFAIIIGLGLNIGLAFVVANMARKKGYSYGGFWALSFFAGFIIGLIVVLCLTDKTVPPPYQQYYQPPYGQPYQPPYQQSYQPPYQPQPAQAVLCPNCGNNVGDAAFCSKCGAKIK